MAIIFVSQFLFFFHASLIDVPWGDGLLAIREFEELGLVGFLTKPVNEHFVLVPRLINSLDLYLGHYALPISGHLTLVAYLSFVFFSARLVLASFPMPLATILMAGLAVTAFSTYRLTVLSNPINNSHFLVGFFSAVSIWWSARAIHGKGAGKVFDWAIAFAAGVAAVGTAASGAVSFLVVAVFLGVRRFAVQLNGFNKMLMIVSLTLASFIGLALVTSFNTPSTDILPNLWATMKFGLGILGLPISGLTRFGLFGLLVGGLTAGLAIWAVAECLANKHSGIIGFFGLGLVCWGLLTIFLIALFRHQIYGDFIGQGHRYGIYNLFVHIGIVFAARHRIENWCRSGTRLRGLQRASVVLAVMGLVSSAVIGNMLSDRKAQFGQIASQLTSDGNLDVRLFRQISFFSSESEAREIYTRYVYR